MKHTSSVCLIALVAVTAACGQSSRGLSADFDIARTDYCAVGAMAQANIYVRFVITNNTNRPIRVDVDRPPSSYVLGKSLEALRKHQFEFEMRIEKIADGAPFGVPSPTQNFRRLGPGETLAIEKLLVIPLAEIHGVRRDTHYITFSQPTYIASGDGEQEIVLTPRAAHVLLRKPNTLSACTTTGNPVTSHDK
jgi:hypothetical protein